MCIQIYSVVSVVFFFKSLRVFETSVRLSEVQAPEYS